MMLSSWLDWHSSGSGIAQRSAMWWLKYLQNMYSSATEERRLHAADVHPKTAAVKLVLSPHAPALYTPVLLSHWSAVPAHICSANQSDLFQENIKIGWEETNQRIFFKKLLKQLDKQYISYISLGY